MKILLIEDDEVARKALATSMREKGFAVIEAADGVEGLIKARRDIYDALVVDRMLPKMDGLSLIRQLREIGDETPVLVLTALNSIDDTIEGLEAGGDDYMAKPCAFPELVARLNVLTKRNALSSKQKRLMIIGLLEIDVISRRVCRATIEIPLQPREFDLLVYLASHAGEAVTRKMLLENVWGMTFDPQTNVVDVHISRLRNKMHKGFRENLINTVRGVGYVLSEDSAKSGERVVDK